MEHGLRANGKAVERRESGVVSLQSGHGPNHAVHHTVGRRPRCWCGPFLLYGWSSPTPCGLAALGSPPASHHEDHEVHEGTEEETPRTPPGAGLSASVGTGRPAAPLQNNAACVGEELDSSRCPECGRAAGCGRRGRAWLYPLRAFRGWSCPTTTGCTADPRIVHHEGHEGCMKQHHRAQASCAPTEQRSLRQASPDRQHARLRRAGAWLHPPFRQTGDSNAPGAGQLRPYTPTGLAWGWSSPAPCGLAALGSPPVVRGPYLDPRTSSPTAQLN